MGYPLKTSDNNWLEKALELYEKRISFSIIDDAGYNFNIHSDVLKIFKRSTLSKKSLLFLIPFYVLAIVCMVLLYYSFSLQYTKYLGVILSALFLVICVSIPTYFLVVNRSPEIEKTVQGIDIKFSKSKK